MIKAILFDLWGTIAYNKSTKPYHNLIDTIKFVLGKTYKDHLFVNNVTEAQFIHDLKIIGKLNPKKIDSLLRKQKENCALYRDSVDALEKLKGKYSLGIVSNTLFISKYAIPRLGLEKYMDLIIFSYDVGLLKPQKEIFFKACATLKLKPEEVLFIGDSYEQDYLGSKAAGLNALLLDRENEHPELSENRISSLTGIFNKLKILQKSESTDEEQELDLATQKKLV